MWAQLTGEEGWIREYCFAPPRRWRFDFAHPARRLAIEVDGGGGKQAHGQVSRREKDYEKHNEATIRGWRVLHGSTAQAEDGRLLDFVRRCDGTED